MALSGRTSAEGTDVVLLPFTKIGDQRIPGGTGAITANSELRFSAAAAPRPALVRVCGLAHNGQSVEIACKECPLGARSKAMRLTVLNVSYPLAPVSSGTAGGAEQVLAMLDGALVSAGHRSLVIAPTGSKCHGLLLPVPTTGSVLDEDAKRRARVHHREVIYRALKHFPVDVVHLHGIDVSEYIPECDVPIIVTLHLPLSWYPEEVFRWQRSNIHFVCVSNTQALSSSAGACVEKVIANGISVDQLRPVARKKGNYAVCVGRICPEKGFQLALDACTACGLPLLIAGKVYAYPEHTAYFENEIRPRLKDGHRFVGPVGGMRKRALLSGAACVIIPSLVEETSSLVAMEAMACGTPVVAFRRGALPEIIAHERTGVLVDDPGDLTSAIRKACVLDGAECRREAERRFSAKQMTDAYLRLYENIVSESQRSNTAIQKAVPFSKRSVAPHPVSDFPSPCLSSDDLSSDEARHCA
jgi:glycosyltransferase involved in cell wall biosynthesis